LVQIEFLEKNTKIPEKSRFLKNEFLLSNFFRALPVSGFRSNLVILLRVRCQLGSKNLESIGAAIAEISMGVPNKEVSNK
jgi:hypothetical protein